MNNAGYLILFIVDPPKRPMIEIPDYTRLPVVVPMPGLNTQRTFKRQENTKPIDYSKNYLKVSNIQSEKCRIGSNIQELPYTTLVTGTHNFNEECCIGGGAWGTVYLGDIPPFGCVAVKKLHSSDVPDPVAQFRSEIETLSQLSHENLLPLYGFSVDGPSLCLIYQFMENGALQDRLSSQDSSKFLSCKTRLDIALGAASGLCHLHNALDRPIVHRDVKTANILLDTNLTPKLGDFGLVRFGSNGSKSYATTTIFGTSAYMAPEAFRGDVSIKMDVFSFGVVLLELLTGLPPFDEDREGWDIVSHVLELDDINTIVDNKAGKWNENIVNNLYCLIKDCLHSEKKKRPNMNIVLERLKELNI
uniref:non-specific serine/threonine protein kinase n=1 Tax=Clastoptera arizonana TaxID=38151 RepID=A0A1B6DSQ3_9HEMI